MTPRAALSWPDILRLGLVQMCLGAIVVLMTSTLNRLMVVELALPAVLPGFLVALHYGVQITRPHWGFRSDTAGNRTRWIIGGMAALAAGGFGAALAIGVLEQHFAAGLALSVLCYGLIGLGVGASGTSLLALLATATAPERRAAAAMTTWLMMIGGIALTAMGVGALLDPYSHALLLRIVAGVALGALGLTVLAVRGIEARVAGAPQPDPEAMLFRHGIAEIWAERKARHFTLFVFLSMTAYFMQELIMEPFAGLVFGFTPGQSTTLSGAQNGGVFLGMVAVGLLASGLRIGSLRTWVVLGCLGSASALLLIGAAGQAHATALLMPAVVGLGFFNGIFAVAAIGAMMALAGEGRAAREGTRMGLWGAAQAMAAGFGGLMGAALADLARSTMGADAPAFAAVFGFEAALFALSALVALRVIAHVPRRAAQTPVPGE
ncbi:MAG: MFS transporter [Alphaproteobacteria bacterium HGW-Alphaproteobacteria-2]|nr:MAG: MFS transporter [Alphaproteobacteria bacterium HGW-Alphaproteobacteria-2]